MAAEPSFVDTNVLVYANEANALRHADALTLLGAAAERGELWISSRVLREYLAVVTRPQSGTPPLPMTLALERVLRFTERMRVAEDGPDVRAHLRNLLLAHPTGGRQVHDANIVATMLAYGLRRLLTFNTGDFRRFVAVIELMPLPSA